MCLVPHYHGHLWMFNKWSRFLSLSCGLLNHLLQCAYLSSIPTAVVRNAVQNKTARKHLILPATVLSSVPCLCTFAFPIVLEVNLWPPISHGPPGNWSQMHLCPNGEIITGLEGTPFGILDVIWGSGKGKDTADCHWLQCNCEFYCWSLCKSR